MVEVACEMNDIHMNCGYRSQISFDHHAEFLKLSQADAMMKANLTSITTVHVCDSFHIQFPPIKEIIVPKGVLVE